MTRMEWADRRIAEVERELARVQFEETVPRQMQATFARERLNTTLSTAIVYAHTAIVVLDQICDGLEENIERMQRDLNGKE